MKKMREINYIFYMTLLYMLSSLYTLLNKGEVYKLFDIEKLIKYDSLVIIVVVLGVIFLLVNYYRNTNEVIKIITLKTISPIVVILLGLNYPNFGLDGIMYAVVVYLIVTYIFMYPVIFCKNKIRDNESTPKLYPSRRNLMDVLNHALGEYSLIALDGTWGSGKTTFMNIAMRENREKYHYIPINVMLFENRNSLKTEFLNQLKGIFKEEGIFQGSLMDFDYYLDVVSNDWIKVVKNIIFSKSKSFKEANKKLKGEIGKIEKRIVVGVDNLERIYGESEPEWKQILGFIHELQELGIKIVVMANLEEMLTTKKETGEKDLSNYEYFDKFYEFKLKLNEVTTEEIIDGINFYNNNLFKEMLKKELKKLIDNLDMGYSIKENAKEVEETKDQYKELLTRYQNSVKNPRKIIKIVKDIENKKKTIKNIYKFIDEYEYEKLIFKASMFSLIYFDYMNEIKNEEFSDFIADKKININNFFGYFFKNIGESYRGLKRLLHRDAEEGLIIERIENIIKNKEKWGFDLERTLKDLEIYSSILDPDFDQEKTKKAYKIIESKLIELEKKGEEKTREVIKEYEEFICRMNYLTYPNELGIYKKIKYKFTRENIFKPYSKAFKMIDDFIYRSVYHAQEHIGREITNFKTFRTLMLLYIEIVKDGILTDDKVHVLKDKIDKKFDDELKLKDQQELIKEEAKEIENQMEIIVDKPSAWSSIRIQKLYFEELKNLLHIIKKENLKEKVIRNDLKKWNDLHREIELCGDLEIKYKLFQKIYEIIEENGTVEFYEKGIKVLKNTQENEDNRKIIFEVEKKIIEYTKGSFWLCIEDLLNEKEHLEKGKLVEYINDELKKHKYCFIKDDLVSELEKKGIIEKEGEWVIKFQGEMEEEQEQEQEERGEGVEEEENEI